MSTAPTILTSDKAAGLKQLEKTALNGYCRKIFKTTENIRTPFYATWYENLAFMQDMQYAKYDEDIGLVNTPKAFGEASYRAVVNLIIGAHQNLIAKTVKTRPRPLVIPINGDSLSVDVVRFMRQLDDYLEIKLDRARIREEVLGWVYIAGCGITKSFFNPYAGDNLASSQVMTTEDSDLQGLEDENLTPAGLPIFKRVNQGELDYSVKSPFEIGFDARNSVRRHSKFYYDQTSITVDEFRERFPDTWRNVKAKSSFDKEQFDTYQERLRQQMGHGLQNHLDSYALPANARAFGEDIKVVEFYFAPNDMWPEGVFLQWTPNAGDDGILGVTTSPWYFDVPGGRRHIYMWHPYTFYDDIIVPGKPFSRATLESNKHVQRMLNRNVSSIQEFINLVAKQRILLQKGIQVDREGFSDRMLDFIEVSGGDFKETVQQLPMPQLPSVVTDQRNYLNEKFDIIVHQTLEEEGKAVRSNLSGDAIEYLDALQSVFMTPKVEKYVAGLTEDSRKHVLLAKQFYPKNLAEDRNVVIAGRSGRHRVRLFNESLVSLDAKFHVVGISDLTRNVAARKAESVKLYGMGAFGPQGSPEATDALIKTQEFGNLEDIFEVNSLQDILVSERVDAILDNMEPPDDGPWHFEIHDKAIKLLDDFRLKYYGLIDEIQRQRVDYLVTEHQRFKAEKDMAMEADSNAMGGGVNLPSEKDQKKTETVQNPSDVSTLESKKAGQS